MEFATVISAMRELGLDTTEILKTVLLVVFNFIIVALIIWRVRKPIKTMYDAVMGAMQAVPEVKKDIADLNQTLRTHVEQTNERLIEGNSKFEQHSEEIKMISQQIKTTQDFNAKQFKEMVMQVRWLYTKLQIEDPKQDETNTTQGG